MRKSASILIPFLLILSAVAAFAGDKPVAVTLTPVEPSLVCMVNEHYMGKQQIPVEVDGRTYYGCCEMCKEKLAKDAASRIAVDPVSKKTVDKAKAVIGADADGRVYYFESAANLKKFKG